jgi:hypothetical protein
MQNTIFYKISNFSFLADPHHREHHVLALLPSPSAVIRRVAVQADHAHVVVRRRRLRHSGQEEQEPKLDGRRDHQVLGDSSRGTHHERSHGAEEQTGTKLSMHVNWLRN